MSLKYRILIIFVIAVFSRSSAQFCSRSYVNGKWISKGDCGGAEMMSDIMRDLQRRSEEENKKCTVGNSGNSGKCDYCNHHPNTCQPGGKCLNYDNHPYYTCDCTDGYYGKNCSQKYCEHHPNPCQHNGTCLNNNTHPYHTCNCTDGYYGKNCSDLARSCEDVQSALARNGVFKLDIPEVGITNVFCDVTDDGGNWTVFQRRMNGDVDFYRGWDDYVKGFGDLQGDHWLGLEAMHQLTKPGNMEMKIKMIKTDGIHRVAKYSSFSIGPDSDNYTLHVSGYSGNAGDGLSYHNNRQFTTKDADHDRWASVNCASYFGGGWWYTGCGHSNLNGNSNKTCTTTIWWNGRHLRFSEMKFREKA